MSDAAVAFGYRSKSVYFTPPEGQQSEVIYTYEIPDDCTLEYECSLDNAPVVERRAFEGLTDGYLRTSQIAYYIARNAAIDLAEGVGLLGPDPASECVYDFEEWKALSLVSTTTDADP